MGVGGDRVGVEALRGGIGVGIRRVGVGVRHKGNLRPDEANPLLLLPALLLDELLLVLLFDGLRAAQTLLRVANDSRAEDDVTSDNLEKFKDEGASEQDDRVGDGGVEYDEY